MSDGVAGTPAPGLRRWLRHDVHPMVQFVKYGIGGGLATLVDLLVTYVLSWKVFPALTANDLAVRLLGLSVTPVSEDVRFTHYWVNRAIAFLFSNLTAYLINIRWVFVPGRHRRATEVTLFYGVSGLSFVLGTALGSGLIALFAWPTTNALFANVLVSVMINYAGRKFFVFKR